MSNSKCDPSIDLDQSDADTSFRQALESVEVLPPSVPGHKAAHIRMPESRLNSFPRENNFQWLRLMFASQVVLVHAVEDLGGYRLPLINHLPGVPAFFFVSGFLIYASFRNAGGRWYFENRALRLLPGLILVTVGGAAVALVAHGIADLVKYPLQYLVWFVSQITLGQAYNPGLFRDVGLGVINGSLWTLTTEILFYVSVPVIVRLEQRAPRAVWYLSAISFGLYVVGPHWLNQTVYRDKSVYDVLALTPLVWGWMFGCGILAFKHYDTIAKWLWALPLMIVPLILLMLTDGPPALWGSWGNRLGLLYFVAYVALVFYAAFGLKPIRLETDLSYGVYIWHGPIINLILVLTLPKSVGLVFALTFAMAAVSWFLAERPALRHKRRSLKPVMA